jgi:hypothetical protein
MLQVELNTIASSFGSVASMTAKLHRYHTPPTYFIYI